MKNLTLGSLFSGSGGFELAGILAGIKPIWLSEIEPYPILVTHNRLPDVQHFGDVSKLNGAELPPVDVVTFGSPCQDMSVAGKRNGLDGSRSGLFHVAVKIIREMRCATNGEYPKFIVWENVEGAYSSNSGEDFRTVLEEICQIKESDIFIPRPPDKWTKSGEILGENFSVAWRTLDAQYWGVPQRRKRIYLVADFDGQRAGSILFESEGLSGYSAESIRAWQGTACRAEKGSGTTICLCDQGGERIDVLEDKTATLRAEAHHPPCILESAGFCTEHSAKSRSIGYESEKSPTLRARVVPAAITLENHPADSRIKISDDNICQTLTSRCGTGGGNVPLLMEAPKVYGICAKHSNAMLSDNPNSGFYEAETSRTLDTSNQSPSKNQGGMVVIEGNGSRPSHQGNGYKESEIMYTLNTVEVPAVAMAESTFSISRDNHFSVSEDVAGTAVARGPATVIHSNGEHYSTSKNSHHTVASHEKANTLVASDWKDPPVVNDAPNNEPAYIVRRLTPTECARLQGLPDWWCKNLDNPNPTNEEIQFWTNVWDEWSKINGKKPKTEKQIRKWLANPYSDSAEYKLYGNAICVNCGYFVLSGIAYFAGQI